VALRGATPHQRERGHRLATARFANDAERLPALDLEGDAAHGVQVAGGRRDVDDEAVHIEQRHVRLSQLVR
jgi:hypothetical protein